jgi:hypothetical protein
MRQAAAKFFANLSAEKREDWQKHFDAFLTTATRIPP